MPEQLFRLGNTQWWVLVDVQNERILDQFNKSQLAATIAALETTTAAQPSFTQMQQDYADLVNLVKAQSIPKDRKDRVVELLGAMYVSHEQSPIIVDVVRIRARLSHLTTLLNQMEE